MSPPLLVTGAVFAAVLSAVLLRQLLGRGPPAWASFLAGAGAMLTLGALPLPAVPSVLDSLVPVVGFLLALFVFAGALAESGALDHLARWLVARAPRPEQIPAVLFVGFGLASALLVNDALVVIGAPVLVAVARRLRLPVRPLLLTLAFAVTVGSALTPFGSPQNLLVSVDSPLTTPLTTFVRYLAVPIAVNLALGAVYLRWRFRREFAAVPRPDPMRRERPVLLPRGGWPRRLARHPVIVLFPVTLGLLVALELVGRSGTGLLAPTWLAAAAAAGVLLVATPARQRVLRQVNAGILVLFAGLFLVVGGAVHGGLVASVERLAPLPGPGDRLAGLAAITATSAVGSQLVSNVPWVALELPVLSAAGYGAGAPVAWIALASASTLAGNLSLLGAASNLLVVDLAERSGERIGLREFVRVGLPLGGMSLAVLFACLAVGL